MVEAEQTTSLPRLKPTWKNHSLAHGSKLTLMRSLVTVFFLSACEMLNSLSRTAERHPEYGNEMVGKILNISYLMIYAEGLSSYWNPW
ncbi:hypothetical protein PoB_005315800 [Plakobranchus ocellatus]|uniref:Uncharacterized protein n=1 Tax=Plakobranchus ocellatus TaxID=259542 RepID=A0AAV4C6N7_9GAST|nr:hypothetical protein PoB_005315800 [Plakobranchus ocellatus]